MIKIWHGAETIYNDVHKIPLWICRQCPILAVVTFNQAVTQTVLISFSTGAPFTLQEKGFQCWRPAPLLDLGNWDWERKSGRFTEFRDWKSCIEKTQSSSRHARVLLWSMNLSFSLTAFPLPAPPCRRRCTFEKYFSDKCCTAASFIS